MLAFLLTVAVMVLLSAVRTRDSRQRFRGPVLFIFDAVSTAYADDAEFRAVANRNFNTPRGE